MGWQWSYSKWTGVSYGPVPVGVIIVLTLAGFHAANNLAEHPTNVGAANLVDRSPVTQHFDAEPVRPPVAEPVRPLPSAADAFVSVNGSPAFEQDLEALNEKRMESLKKHAEAAAARARQRNGFDPSDPAYLDNMADRVLSSNIQYQSMAIDALLQADRATASAETRIKVAKAFKLLSEDDNSFHREKAVQGLVKWAGKYSVPVLIAMLKKGRSTDEKTVVTALAELGDARAVPALVALLGNRHFSPNEQIILTALANMNDARAAPVFAARITDGSFGQCACDGLRAIGPAAEDAVMAVTDTPDTQVCLTAIGLLGEIGTEKSLDLMRRAKESRNRVVRLAAMDAVAKINRRRLKAKS